jgi:tRNA 2-thiouridine synthesizing protein E
MPTVEYKGKVFEVDEDGFLAGGLDAWCKEGIQELTEEHWKVINVLQDYYRKNGVAPMVRILSKVTGFPLKKIYELFPSGPGKGACKMAGLPKPTGCV